MRHSVNPYWLMDWRGFESCTFRYVIPNHWFVVLRNRLQYVSLEKVRDGILIQISRNKNMLLELLMGSPSLATRRNRTLQVEVNMPTNVSVSMSIVHVG